MSTHASTFDPATGSRAPRKSRNSSTKGRKPSRRKLLLEQLEDRRLLATSPLDFDGPLLDEYVAANPSWPVAETESSSTLAAIGAEGEGDLEPIPHANPNADRSPFAQPRVQESLPPTPDHPLDAAPTVYDLRSVGDTSYVTSVKNQASCGSCWTFATMASLESSILMDGGTTRDLSENNLKNYHGFDAAPCAGGNVWMSGAYFTRGSGPVNETDDPYSASDDRETPPPTLDSQYYVRESLWFDTDDEIKNAIMARGALYTALYWSETSYRSSDQTYYYSGGTSTNHGVTIVGWDDNKATAAPTSGAWLIKNSWGSSWGASGYFWLSYADTAGGNAGYSFEDAVPADTYSNVFYHDEFGDVDEWSAPYAFNAFTPAVRQVLKSVQFWTQADNAGYTIRIYDTFAGGTLSNQLVSTTGTIAFAGQHTIDLPTQVTVNANDPFYVYLHITNGGSYPQAFDYAAGGYASASTASAGQSYFSSFGISWTDLTTYFDPTANFAIKALSGMPEINVQGNSQDIVDGNTTPTTADHTDFGNVLVSGGALTRTFTIQNSGNADLSLTGSPLVSISGAHAADFSVAVLPSTPVTAGGSTRILLTQ